MVSGPRESFGPDHLASTNSKTFISAVYYFLSRRIIRTSDLSVLLIGMVEACDIHQKLYDDGATVEKGEEFGDVPFRRFIALPHLWPNVNLTWVDAATFPSRRRIQPAGLQRARSHTG
jgi:hypothetical protein